MYERVQKNSSSWSPAFHQHKSESLFRPRPFSIQPEADTEASEEQEIPAYSRADRDAISAKLLKSMGGDVQSQAETQSQKPQSESEELDSDEILNEAETLNRLGEKDEMSISLTTPVAESMTGLTHQCYLLRLGMGCGVLGVVRIWGFSPHPTPYPPHPTQTLIFRCPA
jgi:hypothetical protein